MHELVPSLGLVVRDPLTTRKRNSNMVSFTVSGSVLSDLPSVAFLGGSLARPSCCLGVLPLCSLPPKLDSSFDLHSKRTSTTYNLYLHPKAWGLNSPLQGLSFIRSLMMDCRWMFGLRLSVSVYGGWSVPILCKIGHRRKHSRNLPSLSEHASSLSFKS